MVKVKMVLERNKFHLTTKEFGKTDRNRRRTLGCDVRSVHR